MVSTYAYPNFKLSNAILLLAKLLLESESWGCVECVLRLPTHQTNTASQFTTSANTQLTQ